MTDAELMDANCRHGIPWYDCEQCEREESEFYERERMRAREFIADWFCDPDDGMPDFNAADDFIGKLRRFGYIMESNS